MNNSGGIQDDFLVTCDYIASRFKHWHASNYRKYSANAIISAIFDSETRANLLTSAGIFYTPSNGGGGEDEVEYTLEMFVEETGLPAELVTRWLLALERKKHIILYGPPGTGKTFIAKKMARLLVSRDGGYMDNVQFHPSYSYEDFIQGIRPQTSGGQLSYSMVDGRFLEFCRNAGEVRTTSVLIIDEINRANLSRVFGELMLALEYRDEVVRLAGGDDFQIPVNVRIIGTMNTADRSIALVDHALRRRFAFIELYPNMDILRHFHEKTGLNVSGLIHVVEKLNERIDNPHYSIGISYFLQADLRDHLEDVWKMEIEPYLNEYFFDHPDWVRDFSWEVIKAQIAL
jgi:5-methylcytosine-specific restriction protein B